jgi:hypothetical protein
MQKYNLANRSRDKVSIAIFYEPTEKLSLGFNMDKLQDDYSDSALGLQNSDQHDVSADATYRISKAISLQALLAQTRIKSDQAGSESSAEADWWAENDDRMNLVNVGVKFQSLRFKLDGGVDYTYARAVGETQYTGADDYPDYTSTRHTFRLYGDYELDNRSALSLLFQYEEYEEESWSSDDVALVTIPHVLTLGETSPAYNIGVIWMGYKYKF